MKKVVYFCLLACIFYSCQNEEPLTSGQIVATIGCMDTRSNYHYGYIIKTSKEKYLMTFFLDKEYVPIIEYGCYDISPIDLPYLFTYEYVHKNDTDFVDYLIPVNNAMFMAGELDLDKVKQARIIPKKE